MPDSAVSSDSGTVVVVAQVGGGAPGKASRAGLDVVMSAPWYLDHLGDDWLKMYKARIDENFVGGGEGKLLGGEACSWSEHANEANVEHRIFSRLPSVAERLWSPERLLRRLWTLLRTGLADAWVYALRASSACRAWCGPLTLTLVLGWKGEW